MVTCAVGTENGNDKPSTVCSCTADSNTGTTIYSGQTNCAETDSVGGVGGWNEFCCASTTYPGSGSTCACYYNFTTWFCANDDTYCSCDFVTSEQATDWADIKAGTCNNTTGSDNVPWVCWTNGSSCDCYEKNANTPAMPAGAVIVSNCINPPTGWVAPGASCPSGTTETNQCFRGAAATSPGGSGGCSGGCPPFCDDGICCSGTCSNGSCSLDNCN